MKRERATFTLGDSQYPKVTSWNLRPPYDWELGAVVAVGSWLCENASQKRWRIADLREVGAFGHFAEFGGFFVWKRF